MKHFVSALIFAILMASKSFAAAEESSGSSSASTTPTTATTSGSAGTQAQTSQGAGGAGKGSEADAGAAETEKATVPAAPAPAEAGQNAENSAAHTPAQANDGQKLRGGQAEGNGFLSASVAALFAGSAIFVLA